jgi:hypothetical protein
MLALQTSRYQGFKEKVCELMLATVLSNIKDHDATMQSTEYKTSYDPQNQ